MTEKEKYNDVQSVLDEIPLLTQKQRLTLTKLLMDKYETQGHIETHRHFLPKQCKRLGTDLVCAVVSGTLERI